MFNWTMVIITIDIINYDDNLYPDLVYSKYLINNITQN